MSEHLFQRPAVLELCAGAGGQALGLEMAGFDNAAAVEIDPDACATLKRNRPGWTVIQADIREFDAAPFEGVDLVAAGVPCPPFSIAGRQLGPDDERDLFPAALRIIEQVRPRAVLFENVKGLASARFASYRRDLFGRLADLGYETEGRLLNASDFGVPQLRPRYLIVAVKSQDRPFFAWPSPLPVRPTVGSTIGDLMAERGWPGAAAWQEKAAAIAPTLVGGSRKHGGPDLGPTRARAGWAELGVNGLGIGAEAPGQDDPADIMPKLTIRMTARIQGFPDEWEFTGRKTAAYRQVGNAFPPPVAAAVGSAILQALGGEVQPVPSHGQLMLLETAAAGG